MTADTVSRPQSPEALPVAMQDAVVTGALAPPLLLAPPRLAGMRPPMLAYHRTQARMPSHPADIERGHRLCKALRDARVGGTFWGARPALDPPPPRLIHLTARSSTSEVGRPHAETPALVWIESGAGPGRSHAPHPARMLHGEADPWYLCDQVRTIVARRDQPFALLASIAGCCVIDAATGQPLARDSDTLARRAIAALVHDFEYRDPWRGHAIEAEAAIALLADWRQWIERNRQIAVQHGMRRWKRVRIDAFLERDGKAPPHIADETGAIEAASAAEGVIALWPSRVSEGFRDAARARSVESHCVEDGFIRSLGLGVHLVLPQSITIDSRAPHYDPREPSDLELLLQSHHFDAALVARARALRRQIVAARIGKYGRADGARVPPRLPLQPGRRHLLVIGQVADDQSMRFGDPKGLGNAGLLRAVRAEHGDAFIVFKPHPDTLSGHRHGGPMPPETLALADTIADGGTALTDLLDQVDEVHVLSSLAGFEALLRDVPVVCHGQPFYAGWALTSDRIPIPRRTRMLSLDELVAGALILYPRYLDPLTGLPCPAEVLVDRLSAGRLRRSPLARLRQAQGALHRLARR
jgi:capsular polysaccharide export protein